MPLVHLIPAPRAVPFELSIVYQGVSPSLQGISLIHPYCRPAPGSCLPSACWQLSPPVPAGSCLPQCLLAAVSPVPAGSCLPQCLLAAVSHSAWALSYKEGPGDRDDQSRQHIADLDFCGFSIPFCALRGYRHKHAEHQVQTDAEDHYGANIG